MRKIKYLSVWILPVSAWMSFTLTGFWSYLPLFIFFAIVPMIEFFYPRGETNLSEEEILAVKIDPFYDFALYILVPIQWVFLGYFLVLMNQEMGLIERIGRISSMGIMCGVIGINVGHELGHRASRMQQFMGELLLLSSLETHFLPYHNSGHHAHAGTFEDPATARLNESVYRFMVRSHVGSYLQAWKFEALRMHILNKSTFNFRNKMVQYSLVQVLLLITVYVFFGPQPLLCFLGAAVIGIILLELVNYIEHYGLMRKKRENGTYEVFKRCHAWNANEMASRVLLFELSRHSDHHMKPDKPYQTLDCEPESPVMPTGYSGMMILSLLPPVFFKIMNPRVSKALDY